MPACVGEMGLLGPPPYAGVLVQRWIEELVGNSTLLTFLDTWNDERIEVWQLFISNVGTSMRPTVAIA